MMFSNILDRTIVLCSDKMLDEPNECLFVKE